jgi:pimeloyl-ACP methyl ester carboxylesterase
MLLALTLFPHTELSAQVQTPDKRKCIDTLNKSFAKVAKTQGKDISKCIKDGSKGKLENPTIEDCLTADNKKKVSKAKDKTVAAFNSKCDKTPDFGPSDPNTVNQAAVDKELDLIDQIFGSDLEAVIIKQDDPNTPNAKATSKCQIDITKAATKCQDAKLKAFNKCKKAGLKEETITSASGLEGCMDFGGDSKVVKFCDEKLGDKIAKKCGGSIDLELAFPGCDSDDPNGLKTCIDVFVECGVCRGLNAADGLNQDCDLFDDGIGNSSCGPAPIWQETVDIPSEAQPAETPGSPGVVATNPDLITQFGDPNFSLNNARYTRWRFGGLEQTPDAILILVAGFGGGANNFKSMAEDLLSRVLDEHGLVIEVWGFHRRTNQLEDREGILIAQALADPLVALDWYYGDDLGLTLHSALAAGPNRRATFYNTSDDIPFLANFTSQVHSLDIDAVVDAARAIARNNNVFLGGHSAGTDFTARYAATDFNLTGAGDSDPGYAKLRGLVLLEGHAGRTGSALSDDSLDRIIAKFDGGLFGAVRDDAARCVDGTTACTIETEAGDCNGQVPPKCTLPETAYAAVLGLSPQVTASSEPVALQRLTDSDSGQVILQVDQGASGNNAVTVVPELLLLSFLPPSTVDGLLGAFLDDDGFTSGLSPSVATSVGAPGPVVEGLATWHDITEGPFSTCQTPSDPNCVLIDNGPAPTSLDPNFPDRRWGQEKEVVRLDRFATQFLAAGSNAADWYFASSGLSVTSAPGVCDNDPNDGSFLCTVGNVPAACSEDRDCAQSISLDSSALSVGRGRRDIVNLTQAAEIDIPVICFGGSNGLTPVPASYVPFAESIGICEAPSCDSLTARLVDPNSPNEAFPTFGDVNGGFEVHISEGFAHNDVTTAEDNADNNVLGPLSDFIERNTQ